VAGGSSSFGMSGVALSVDSKRFECDGCDGSESFESLALFVRCC